MAEVLVVVSKVKKMAKEAGMRTSADYINTLSEQVAVKVRAAIEKAKAGNKKTIQSVDAE